MKKLPGKRPLGEGTPGNPLKPSASLLCKLGSIAVHVEEGSSENGHHFDWVALNGLIRDPEVQTWLTMMGSMALVPRKRK